LKKGLFIFSFVFAVGCFDARAQQLLDYTFDGSEQGKALRDVLLTIQSNSSGKIYFLDSWLTAIPPLDNFRGRTLGEVLGTLFANTDLSFISMYPSVLVIVKDPQRLLAYKETLQAIKREDVKIERFAFGTESGSRKPVRIVGRILDSKSQESLPGAIIQVLNTPVTTTTDAKGQYSLEIEPGRYVVQFSFPKYDEKVVDLSAYANGEMVTMLDQSSILLQEIVIEDKAATALTTSRVGQADLLMSDLKRAPALLGEVDVIKQIQILPGVTTVGEAASGFNVRGGSVDQNLILYDGIPIYNSSHIFGFLSAFNPEAVGEVSFMRGGIPARYGGRASSVLDIRSKEGSYKKWNGNAGIGLITSNFMINGPIKKEKTSVLASLRSTYSNWLIRSLRTDYGDLQKSSVVFYDGTVGLSHAINNDTKISVSSYFTKDAFRLVGDSTYQWMNFQTSARLNHIFANGMEGDFVLGLSNYRYKVSNDFERTAFELAYRIVTTVLRAGFKTERNNQLINFGAELSHYGVQPGKLTPASTASNVKSVTMPTQFSLESALYGSDEVNVTEALTVEAGLRIPVFMSFGPSRHYRYQPGPITFSNIVDTVSYNAGEIIKTYAGLEPRLAVRYSTGQFSSIKFGYNRINQFLHLVSNTAAVTPVDIWQPSGYYFKPQRADQVSLGYYKESKNKKYNASIEGFYKTINNMVDFKDGAKLILNDHLETELLQGKGESYGLETFVTKDIGRLTGSINYTYSRSFRLMAGSTKEEQINNGKRYPSNYDQPHIVNFSWKYGLTSRYFFTGYFTYHSGRPVTVPLSAFTFENSYIAYFSGRNQYRIPAYHRLDLALVIEGSHKKHKRVEGHWVLSVYNVYSRKNPYTVFFRQDRSVLRPYQLSIVGTALPSVSYNLKF
jgi:outer membrane cobalamin receptor